MTEESRDPNAAPSADLAKVRAQMAGAASSGRRRFLLGGIIATPAILTLTTRPALANQCSISGMQSGNLSRPNDVTCQGLTIGYWKTHPYDWPDYQVGPCNPITKTGGTCSDYAVATSEQLQAWIDSASTPTEKLQRENAAQTYLAELSLQPGTPFAMVFGPGIASDPTLTLMQALWNTGNGGTLLAQAVAALLNAYRFGAESFGYTPEEIIQMVQNGISDEVTLLANLTLLNERD